MFVKLIVLNFFMHTEFLKKVRQTVATFDGSKLLKLKRKQLWSEFKIFNKLFKMINTHRWKTCIYIFRIVWKRRVTKFLLNKLIGFIFSDIIIILLNTIIKIIFIYSYFYSCIHIIFHIFSYTSYIIHVAHLVQSLQVNLNILNFINIK